MFWNLVNPGYGPIALNEGVGVPTQAEATAFFARQATPMPANYETAFNRYIYDHNQVSAWVWYRHQILGGYTKADCLLSLMGATGTLADTGGTTTFEAGLGLTGDGVGGLIGWGTTASVVPDATNVTFSFMTTKAGNMIADIGLNSASFNTLVVRGANSITGRIIAAASTIVAAVAAGVGVVTVRRTGTTLKIDLNGVNMFTGTGAATTISGTLALFIASTQRSTDRIFMAAVGPYLDDVQTLAHQTAVLRLAAALGWAAPAYTSFTRASSSIIPLPGNSGASVANKGIVLTGMCKDIDGTWWGSDYGIPVSGDPTGWASRIVQLSSDFSTILTSIYATDLGLAATVGFQGLAIDTSDDTLFVTSPTASRIYQVSKAGSLLATLTKTANGLAYNSLTDTLIMTTTSNLLSIDKATAADVGLSYKLPFEVDQIYFDAANNRVFTTGGSNGSPCQMSILDLAGPYGNYPAETERVTLTNVLAAEGIVIDGSTAYVSSDEAFHLGGSSINSVQTIDLTGIV